ncbi:hypothetical protein SGFS_083070 [Streptomyces graminofaciens]|uniref:Uncharacterized protein n=1 Tax=Streptomyces graminofaciens TaxID=68212 RepID=A0ABM7FL21_9ACTN|nr:hypothetical protein SGFS_083070 [Streptomyces graminofaciens]
MPGTSENPVQVAHPVTAMTATIPTKTGLILRSLRRDAAVVMGLLGLWLTGTTARPYRAHAENVSPAPWSS